MGSPLFSDRLGIESIAPRVVGGLLTWIWALPTKLVLYA